ncbi:MAG TPA: hypothetical protein VE971_02950 [Candidatus Eisenbacteria bacterium]|nr:hypothetical protein [Candidatus Eisenbacteria bacterium]
MITPMGTTMKLMLVLAITSLVSLQQLSTLGNMFYGCINNIGNLAFALVSKPIIQRLEYAHFLPLTNNTKLHQVKVIVDYAPISLGKYAYMKVYGPNRALLKISSSPHGVDTIAPGKAERYQTVR